MRPLTSSAQTAPAVRIHFIWWLFVGHALLMFLNVSATLSWIVPVMAREEFAASDWQTTALTASVPTLLLSSIFWNAVLQRVPLWTYLIILWAFSGLPYVAMAFVDRFELLLAVHLCWAIGHAGWVPLSGKLLKWFYSDSIHGRIFSLLFGVGVLATIVSSFFVGRWLNADPNAYRWIFPLAGSLQLTGFVVILLSVQRIPPIPVGAAPPLRRVVFDPILQVVSIFKQDRIFLRYELAFMTYGAAWMICDALLPVLVTDRLKLPYDSFSQSTMMARNCVSLCAVLPWGILLDRVGAVRTSSAAFGVLAGYPILLLIATDEWGLGLANIVFGLGISGIALTWMLGPVSFAPTQELASKYAAIHAMCVGIRGLIFELLGMSLYRLSGSFTLPLLIASGAFLWGARQMWRLHRDVNRVKLAAKESPVDDRECATDRTAPSSDVDPKPTPAPARATV